MGTAAWERKMNKMKNVVICSGSTSAAVVASYEGWWDQPFFALEGT